MRFLKNFSEVVKLQIRESDTFARIGGDEFVMILHELENEDEITNVIKRILDQLKEPFLLSGHKVSIDTSIGVSLYPKDAECVDELLTMADLAMYKAKESGSNQFQFYTPKLNQHSDERIKLGDELKKALEQQQLVLYYQPQFHLETNKIVTVEALVRWHHPTLGIVAPLDFLPLAVKVGLIIPICEWVLKTACEQNKAWQDKGLPHVRMAVNIGEHQLKNIHFISSAKKILQDAQLDPKYLEIEITENIIFSDETVINKIDELRKMGVHVALDDFGVDKTSIKSLKNFPLDNLKIDPSFIQNPELKDSNEVILQAIIAMAKSLSLNVTAEGVETQQQLNFLKENNCDDVQGFLFSKPLSAGEIEGLLKKFK